MTRGIRVKNTDDIQKINKIVTKYGFDIWIHGKSGMVDAKSLLGMFLLSLNEPLQIVLEDDVDATALFKDLADYLEIDDEVRTARKPYIKNSLGIILSCFSLQNYRSHSYTGYAPAGR